MDIGLSICMCLCLYLKHFVRKILLKVFKKHNDKLVSVLTVLNQTAQLYSRLYIDMIFSYFFNTTPSLSMSKQ